MFPGKDRRFEILEDTISKTENLVELYQDAKDSIFLSKNLVSFADSGLRLNHGRNEHMLATGRGRVISGDTLDVARGLLDAHPDYKNKILVLNCCSGEKPGGGIDRGLGVNHEDRLIYSSTLLYTLKKQAACYPFSEHTQDDDKVCGIYSPAVVIFKDTLEKDCVELPEPKVVSVISITAPKDPTQNSITNPDKVAELKEKIVLALRVGVQKRKSILVLGPLGCGSYGWKADDVAAYMCEATKDEEFQGFFEEIVIAVIGKGVIYQTFDDLFTHDDWKT